MERETGHGAQMEEWLVVPAETGDWEAAGMLSERRVRRWALVMAARGIPCRVESGSMGWRLLVPAGHYAEARAELSQFIEENRDWPPPEPPPGPLAENTLTTLSVLFLLATFHNLTRFDLPLFGHQPPDWFGLGNADAGKIMAGEWWRLATALTLHADWLHLAGNLALGGVVIVWLCRDLGSGLAWSLLLCSGILGNLVNALVHPPEHGSVGSSTALFGAVGILAALGVVRKRRIRVKRWALPVAAALALLALLGSEGRNTDLGAHLFGFLAGLLLGLAAEQLTGRRGRPGRALNALLALAGAVTVIGAWWAALAAVK